MQRGIKPGYQQTEVGVIPEDWEVVRLGNLGVFSKGQGIRKDQAASGTIPCVRYGELYTLHNEIIREFRSRISPEIAKTSKRLSHGDILFAGSGETKVEIGKCAAFVNDFEAFAGGDIVILSPQKSNSELLGYLLNTPNVAKQKASKGQGDAVVHISATALASIVVALPPTLPEQRAIAVALADADALIAALEGMIAKKRCLKQAAMQHLLTGKTRLPGFSGAWEAKRLGDVAPFQRGFDLPTTQLRPGPFPVVYSNGVLNSHEAFQVKGPGIVTGRSGTIGKVTYVERDFWPHNTALWVTSFKGNDPRFIFFLYTSLEFQRFATGSGVPTLNRNDVHAHRVTIPSDPAEQTAIAEVLSDMDADLAAFEAQAAKARAVKQGMMQELLTGRVRLI